jgi:hypothetical protein
LTDLENKLRQDLEDPAGANQRFATSDLDRAIDRAVDKYSQQSPLLLGSAQSTLPYSRTYPWPPASATGAPWWIESVEYPTGKFPPKYVAFRQDPPGPVIGAPATALALSVAAQASATLPSATYFCKFTWATGSGETLPSPESSIAVTLAQALRVAIPAPPLGGVQYAYIYVSTSAGTETKQGNLNAAPAAGATLDANAGGTFVQATPLVAGAGLPASNMTGQQTFTLMLRDSRIPVDTMGIITMIAAYKHQVDLTLVTVPERHIDVIVLGAYAYCCLAWATPFADNFSFSDGELRDRLDDTQVNPMWKKQGDDANNRFKARLEEVKQQRDAGAAAVANWGDIPARWDRL